MALARELTIKQSCLQELHALPSHMMTMVLQKINFLVQDPIPDGDVKKKLVGANWSDMYRLRIGRYRLFYTFGSSWIRVLGIRQRKEAYESRDIRYEEPGVNVADLPNYELQDDMELFEGVGARPAWTPGKPKAPLKLPRKITVEWLDELGIPAELHSTLIACVSEDDLLAVDAESRYVERVLENLFPRPITEVAQQPEFVVVDTEDLVRFKEGDLLGFLLKLDADQERLVDWALRGPAMIKGGPGTGKSTIALYRVRSLLDHAQKTGTALPRVLFSTYTPALTRFSEQLLQQLLGDRMSNVRVERADEIAMRIVKQHDQVKTVVERPELEARMGKLLADRKAELPDQVARLRPDYVLDEIEWVIEGRGLQSLEEYLSADRAGRGIALNEGARKALWQLYTVHAESLAKNGQWTLSRIRVRALELVRSGTHAERFDAVMIDEAQDLTPASLSLLVELARDARGVYLTADASQSVYYRGFSWQSVHERLKLRGKSVTLRRNYRTTREIAEAANDFLRGSGTGDPDSLIALSAMTGEKPMLLGYGEEKEQWGLAAEFIKETARAVRLKPSAAAILVPSTSIGEQAEAVLTGLGLKARFLRGSQLDLNADEVKIMTLQAAKGLEFPIVVVAGLGTKAFPKLPETLEDPGEREEEVQNARRTLFVGITRAMRGLLLLYPSKQPSPFVAELKPQYWS